VEYLLERLAETGIKAADLQIKVFGGAEVLIPGQYGAAGESVGMQNIKAAFDALQARGLRVTASDVGGSRGRKLVFFTHTGEVLLKRLNADENGAIRKPGRMQGSGA
jgi:chemotaxis protein CheD